MLGKTARMNPLASRKKLLVAESELNRAQLVQAWRTMADEARSLASQAGTIGSLASSAASLAAGLMSFWHKKSAHAAKKPSWLQTVLKVAGLVSTIWQTFRSEDHDQKDK
jgi:hypothetical protein